MYIILQLCLHFHVLFLAEIVSGIVSNVASALVKWLWSLKSTTNIGTYHLLISHLALSLFFLWLFIPIGWTLLFAILWLMGLMGFNFWKISSCSMMNFEPGYTMETMFDGSKLRVEPYFLEISPSRELLVLDFENSNIYKISSPLTRCKLLLI